MCVRLDVGEFIVVVDSGNPERQALAFPVVRVIELEFQRILFPEKADFLLRVLVGGLRGLDGFGARRIDSGFVRLDIGSPGQRRCGNTLNRRYFFSLDEHF